MKIIIVGGGESILTLINLLGNEHDITLIEKDEKIAEGLSEKLNALVIKGDGTDINILNEAGIHDADAVIAATNEDTTNVMICQIAKTENVKKIIPLVRSPKNEMLYTKLGINLIVSSAGTNARAIKRALHSYGDARIIAQLGEGDVQIIEQVISEKSSLIGKKAVIDDSVVATIYRGGKLIIPDKNSILEKGDVLLVAVKTKDLPKIVGEIKGE